MYCRGKEIKEPLEQYGKGRTRRLGQTDANHHRSTLQWSQWSGVNSRELSCVLGKYYGMNYETTAYTEQPLTLPVAPRTEGEVTYTVKQHRVSSSSQWLEAGEGILKKQLRSP